MAAEADPYGLAGRVVLVTGVARGLGRALARRLLEAGARVAGCARGEGGLDALARDHAAHSDRLLLASVDVTDFEGMDRFAHAAQERWGAIDGVVVNASILGERVPLRDADPSTWREVIDVDLNGAFNTCRAALPLMRNGGSIVAVSSGVGDRPRARWGAYAVAKWALEGFTRNLALEEREHGIRANIVDPGAMRTDMRADAYPDEDPVTLPLPGHTTDVYLWLLSDAAADVTGQRFLAQEWRAP